MANQRPRLSIQLLPEEILTIIVEKIGQNSAEDYCNARVTCKQIERVSRMNYVLKTLCLSPLMKHPLRAFQYENFMNSLIEQHNKGAHFVRGILEYFVQNNYNVGLDHLRRSALGHGEEVILEAAYLYGVLKILHGDVDEGVEEMAKLNWENDEDLVKTNEVWKKLRRSLHGIAVTKRTLYRHMMQNIVPPESCHLLDGEITCPDCFHYKRAKKFYHMMP